MVAQRAAANSADRNRPNGKRKAARSGLQIRSRAVAIPLHAMQFRSWRSKVRKPKEANGPLLSPCPVRAGVQT